MRGYDGIATRTRTLFGGRSRLMALVLSTNGAVSRRDAEGRPVYHSRSRGVGNDQTIRSDEARIAFDTTKMRCFERTDPVPEQKTELPSRFLPESAPDEIAVEPAIVKTTESAESSKFTLSTTSQLPRIPNAKRSSEPVKPLSRTNSLGNMKALKQPMFQNQADSGASMSQSMSLITATERPGSTIHEARIPDLYKFSRSIENAYDIQGLLMRYGA
jgi:hypothetical protein